MGTPLTVLTVVLGISFLIIVHETGHYLVARAFKMRVLRYSIGIGPALVRYQPPGSPTVFQLCAIPLLALGYFYRYYRLKSLLTVTVMWSFAVGAGALR